jgi:hypothetical protein
VVLDELQAINVGFSIKRRLFVCRVTEKSIGPLCSSVPLVSMARAKRTLMVIARSRKLELSLRNTHLWLIPELRYLQPLLSHRD